MDIWLVIPIRNDAEGLPAPCRMVSETQNDPA